MPRLPRFCPADDPIHVVQCGNNRQVCFTRDDDMAAYDHNLHEGVNKYGVALNPVRAGMTADPGDDRWSSYRCHAFGNTARMWTPLREYLCFGEHETERQKIYREMIVQSLSAEVIQKIRHCLNTGLVPGTEAFRDQVNALRN